MLGKGLESLIPQKGNPANNGNAASPALPAEPVRIDLPSHGTQPELPAALPAESDLPHSDEQIVPAHGGMSRG